MHMLLSIIIPAWNEKMTIVTGGRTLKRRESCYIWYDGQR